MKKIFSSFIVCFSLYSALPMPRVDWAEDTMAYAFCFFPLVGVLVGFLELVLYRLTVHFHLSSLLYAVLAAILPVFLTGGIHIDGFLDSMDGVYAMGEPSRRLKVMEDPSAGAFGVIYTILYFLLLTGLYHQLFSLKSYSVLAFLAIFSLSRVVSGWMTVAFPSAKPSGLKDLFYKHSKEKVVKAALVFWALGGLALLFYLYQLKALWFLAVILILLWGLKRYFIKHFGGITGDLAGFSSSVTELLLLGITIILEGTL